MLNIEDGREEIFYIFLRGITKTRKNNNLTVCHTCLAEKPRLKNFSQGYGDFKKHEKKIWNRFSFSASCDECGETGSVVYLPLYTIMGALTSMFLQDGYSELENTITIKTNEEVSVYLKSFKKIHDDAGIQEAVEYKDLAYCLPIVRCKNNNKETADYQFVGISQGNFWRYLAEGFHFHSTTLSDVLSSVLNAFVSTYCISTPNDQFEYFLQRLEDIDPFVITDSQYIRIEAKSILSKLHRQTDADEIDFTELVSSSLIDKTEQYLNDAYSKGEKEEIDYANKLFEYLQEGEKKEGVLDTFGHIVTDNWKFDVDAPFDTLLLERFMALADNKETWFQLRWLAQEMQDINQDETQNI